MKITNWGNYPKINGNIYHLLNIPNAKKILTSIQKIIPRGLGKCYGDAALASEIISTISLQKVIDFNKKNGILKAEAGISLEDILNIIIPNGWFLPVTPGTKYVTLGGAIASDVHGKNHHKDSSFSKYVQSFDILLSNNKVVTVSPIILPDLFKATCGGMGLTGIILNATIKLKKIETSFIKQTALKVQNINELFDLFEKYNHYTYSVAWIDCLNSKNPGRSILLLGEHAKIDELPKKLQKKPLKIIKTFHIIIPYYFPSITLNSFSIQMFNTLFYNKHKTKNISCINYNSFFYPLDKIKRWNLIYGKKGFLQYQFVVPEKNGRESIIQILKILSNYKTGSFLSVLKKFGPSNSNYLSFPMSGYTLTLDIPIRKSIFNVLQKIDEIVLKYNGRIYLSKDAYQTDTFFKKTYPYLDKFIKIKKKYDPTNKFASVQSNRLKIT